MPESNRSIAAKRLSSLEKHYQRILAFAKALDDESLMGNTSTAYAAAREKQRAPDTEFVAAVDTLQAAIAQADDDIEHSLRDRPDRPQLEEQAGAIIRELAQHAKKLRQNQEQEQRRDEEKEIEMIGIQMDSSDTSSTEQPNKIDRGTVTAFETAAEFAEIGKRATKVLKYAAGNPMLRMEEHATQQLEIFLQHPTVARALQAHPEALGRLRNLSPAAIALLDTRSDLQRIIQGALGTGQVVQETERACSALESLSTWSKGGRVALAGLGVGADALGIALAARDWMNNEQKIVDTANPELKKLYEGCSIIYVTDGGLSVASLCISGMAFIPSTTGAASALGGVFMPVGMAWLAYRTSYLALKDSETENLKTVRDYEKMSADDILGKLIELSNTKGEDTATRSFVRTLTGNSKTNEEKEYDEQRSKLVTAYLRKTNADMPPEMRKADDGSEREENPEQYAGRLGTYIGDQIRFIARATNNTFQLRNAKLLEDAQAYADLLTAGRAQRVFSSRRADGSLSQIDLRTINEKWDRKDLQKDIDTYQSDILDANRFEQLVMSAGQNAETCRETIRFILRHHFAMFSTKVKTLANRDGEYAKRDIEDASRIEREVNATIDELTSQVMSAAHASQSLTPERSRSEAFQFEMTFDGVRRTLDGFKENDPLFWKLSA